MATIALLSKHRALYTFAKAPLTLLHNERPVPYQSVPKTHSVLHQQAIQNYLIFCTMTTQSKENYSIRGPEGIIQNTELK